MAKYNLEFKATRRDETGAETRHVKRVVEQSELATLITSLATESGVEFFTLRRIVEPKPKPVLKEVKK